MILSQHIFFFFTVSVFKFIYLFALPLSIPDWGGMGLRMVSLFFLLFYSFKSRFSASVPQFKEKSFKIGNKWDPEAQQLLCE